MHHAHHEPMWTLVALLLIWYFGREAWRSYRDYRERKAVKRMLAPGAGLTRGIKKVGIFW